MLALKGTIGGKGGVTARFALVNPVSQQAILRAIADHKPLDAVKGALASWSWDDHQQTDLYRDTHSSAEKLKDWKAEELQLDIRLYSGAVACALVLTQDSAFIEQYLYGRGEMLAAAGVLGGEYPVFEYARSGRRVEAPDHTKRTTEEQVLASTFDVLWRAYSISLKEYEALDERQIFDENLRLLRKELRVESDKGRSEGTGTVT